MKPNLLNRRTLLLATAGLPLLNAHAQVSDVRDAINKAGRQRMLSQRMGKAWLALVHGVKKPMAQQVLDKSLALFDRQLVELKAFAASGDILATYIQLDTAWGAYKTALVGNAPSRDNAAAMLQLNAGVLALAHQGTVQFESAQGKPQGKLINIAGRQRMLSQRMAMYYLAARLPVEASVATAEINKARGEFVNALAYLRQAPENTAQIQEHLQLADGQWVFFDSALKRGSGSASDAGATRSLDDIFITSENLLSVMDQVTGMYASLKT
jgi:nitrate/nitrite-specific signal transduction histidine kinase